MSNHICHYLNYLNLPYVTWARSKDNSKILSEYLSKSTHILILINDSAIDAFIETTILLNHLHKTLIHFSGNLISKYAHSAHPLQTFSRRLYPTEDYQKIPFMIESNGPEFSELLPGFKNPHYTINKNDKNYYHAMCVIANNFTTLLWQKFFSEMQNRFSIKTEDLQPYLDQTFYNIKYDFQNVLTGPLSRNDKKTMLSDLNALKDDDFFNIFDAFTKAFIKETIDA